MKAFSSMKICLRYFSENFFLKIKERNATHKKAKEFYRNGKLFPGV
jgi:hypothetical protein